MSPVGAGQRLTRSARYLPWVLTARAPPAEWRTTLQDRTPGLAWSGQGTIASRPPWGPGRAQALITSLAGTGREPRHLRDSVIQARPWPPLSAMARPRTALAVSGSPSVATSQRDSETPAQAGREIPQLGGEGPSETTAQFRPQKNRSRLDSDQRRASRIIIAPLRPRPSAVARLFNSFYRSRGKGLHRSPSSPSLR